jgi:hypothetical protein
MKVLIIQENGHHALNRNYRECFCLQRGFEKNGIESDVWGYGHNNYSKVPDWKSYDLIFSIENWDWMPNLSKIQTKKYIWAIDEHCKGPLVYKQLANTNNFDKVLHASSYFGEWLPNCFDDTLIKPLKNQHHDSVDVGFCGNVVNRQPLINILKDNFTDFKFDEFVIGDNMVKAINSYKIHWNANIGVDINYRNFETMGCQTMLLTSHHEDYKKLGIKDGLNCLTYSNTMEMVEKAKYALSNEVLRNKIAKNGHEFVKENHTYKHRAKQIAEMIQ